MMPDPDLAWASHSVLVADEEVRDAFAAATSILGEADLEPPIAVGDNGQDGWAVIARTSDRITIVEGADQTARLSAPEGRSARGSVGARG